MPDSSSRTVLVEYAGEHFAAAVKFSARKKLSISVYPDGSVMTLAPVGRSLEEVLTHINRRRSWITRQLRHFEKYKPLPVEKRYMSGETHLYLGRQYRIRVEQSESVSVRLIGKFFKVHVPAPKQPAAIAAAIGRWYQSHAEALFFDLARKWIQTVLPRRTIANVPLRVRPMVGRWGSCSKAGMITLNVELVKAPMHCIDYVIVHELCHLRVHDHSPEFFRLLGRCIPDWKARKNRLDAIVIH